MTFFDPSSPHFTSTFFVILAALGVLFCLGVLYHMTCYNRTRFGGAGSKLRIVIALRICQAEELHVQ